MDLVQTVRKEGSRGGTGDFKWSDVQASSHREHYLGHSIMAPTGRWAKGKDLTWYAKGDKDDEEAAASEADARKAEIKRIKEAEQDAMARALGLPVPDRSNPNNQELGQRKDVEKVLKGAAGGDDTEGKGIGFGREQVAPTRGRDAGDVERIEGNAEQQDKELRYALNEYKRRRGDGQPRDRSRSRDRNPSPERRHRRRRSRDRDYRRRSRSAGRHDERRRKSSPRRDEARSHKNDHRRRHRSRSPRQEDRHRYRRDRHDTRMDR
jgi:hypothetical protein